MTQTANHSAGSQPPAQASASNGNGDVLSGRRAYSLLMISLMLWGACLFAYLHANGFPVEYHPDEPGKADQVLSARRNYRHPQLLLEATQLYVWAAGTPRDRQSVAVAGRQVSAAFAATAVIALALAGFRVGGPLGFLVVGASVGACPPLLLHAHYFKEDAALVLGLSLVVLAAARAGEQRDARKQLRAPGWLGAACAAAASAKYVGLVALLAAVPLLPLWHRPRPDPVHRRRIFRAFGLAFLLVLLAINWRAFRNPGSIVKAFGNQVVDGVVEHKGLTMRKPTAYFARALVDGAERHTLILAAAGTAFVIATWRRRDRWQRMAVLLPTGYLALVSFSSAPNHRHVLPVVVLVHFLAALAVAWWVARMPAKPDHPWRLLPAVAFVALTMLAQWPDCAAVLAQFRDDGRDRVRAWAATALPPGSRVLQDAAAQLHLGRRDGRIVTRGFAPEFGDFDSLASAGITHVVACDLAFGRYFDPHVIPTPAFGDEYARRRAWYERLFREGQFVWSSDPKPHAHGVTNPAIRAYRVRGGDHIDTPRSP